MMEGNIDISYLEDIKTLNFTVESFKVVKCNPANTAIIRKSLLSKVANPQAQRSLTLEFCKYCSRPWSDAYFTLKVRPKPVLGKRIRKLLRKEEQAPGKLTQFECKLLQLVKNNQGNKLILTCLSCKKRTLNQMPKYEHHNPGKVQEKEEENTTKIKKKKKKDIFVGLNPEVVLKTALMSKNSSEESHIINIHASKKIANYTKTFNFSSLNEQKKNLKLQASNKKPRIQQPPNSANTFTPNNVQNNKNYNSTSTHNSINNNSSKDGSFFHKLEMKRNLEKQKKIDNVKHNERMRRMLSAQMAKNSKSNKIDLKNFLRGFGNPTSS